MKISMSERLMHSTIRIEVLNIQGNTMCTGTGFFFTFSINGQGSVPTIVTNKHVVRGAKIGRIIFIASKDNKPVYGDNLPYIIQDFENRFIFHPDEAVDLCIMPLLPILNDVYTRFKKNLFYISLNENIIPTQEQLDKLSTLEDVAMIGYPNGLWDEVNNLPIIRKGSTAIHPKFDYNGKTDMLVDIACFPGSSGSPICICNEGCYGSENGMYIRNRLVFLGILYAGPVQTVTGRIGVGIIPTSVVPIPITNVMLNLGYAVKSKRLLYFKPILGIIKQ